MGKPFVFQFWRQNKHKLSLGQLDSQRKRNGAKRRINWFNFQLRVDTIGCETQTKIRWITTINNHTSYQNKINCFKLHRTVCDSYDKVTLLQILTSKLLAFLSMCVQMSRPKGHVGPVLPSPWFKALYFLGCYTYCTRRKLKGNCTILKLESHVDHFHYGKKKTG